MVDALPRLLDNIRVEQLSRAETYRQNAKDASVGKLVTLGSTGRALTDHLPKLFKARIPMTASMALYGEFRMSRPSPRHTPSGIPESERLENKVVFDFSIHMREYAVLP